MLRMICLYRQFSVCCLIPMPTPLPHTVTLKRGIGDVFSMLGIIHSRNNNTPDQNSKVCRLLAVIMIIVMDKRHSVYDNSN